MWQKLHWRNKKTIGCKTWGTHAFGETHHIVWKEAKSLETEINSVYRNYKIIMKWSTSHV